MGHLWAPLFILKAAHWPSDIGNILPFLQNTSKHIKQLNLDGTNLELFENILLCRMDLLEDKEQAHLAENLLGKSLDALILRTANDKRKFVNILLATVILFRPPAVVLHTLLFKPIIGIVPIETVIATI
ncbi:hypothetical protein NQ314_000158 [Rhamnusium bicolor]|uniref:Uncharacterized protein n=1 Tax=Rhamnusium bicolor TaxID=1586634 RepID=A0AAV8ZWM7_9CUCU|nr:hypothetical protein NQ314_000158 [Rhamnusium bicolor]